MTRSTEGDHRSSTASLRVKRLGLHTQHQAVVIMRTDCHVCRAEGLRARSQILVSANGRHVQATLYQVDSSLLGEGEIGLSESAWSLLDVREGDQVDVGHAPTLESLAGVRRRIHGNRLEGDAINAIVKDVVAGHYTDVHLSAFLTASAALPLDDQETIELTRAMVTVGDRLDWRAPKVLDKHCIGGLPGNRTTPIVVAIVAVHGLVIPKTSSRAITSPAGTADTMEVLAPVDLDLDTMRRVVEAEGGCIAWGGAVRLSPADDVFVRIERQLDIDTEGQLIASVLSKKIAAGATHVVLDIPVGPTAKVRTPEAAHALGSRLKSIAAHFDLEAVCIESDGSQPVGRGIGPALEARDVVAVLRNAPSAPGDLRERAVSLAGAALELGGVAQPEEGYHMAMAALADGRAWRKFERICEAQGGMRDPPAAAHTRPLSARHSGRVARIDNRKIARLAKLAGAPQAKAAGIHMHVTLGAPVEKGEPLLDVHAETPGELDYAFGYVDRIEDIVEITT